MKIKLNYKIAYSLLFLCLFLYFLFFSNKIPFHRVYDCLVSEKFFNCGSGGSNPIISILTAYLLKILFPNFEYLAFRIFNILLDILTFGLIFLILYKDFNKKIPIKYLALFVISYLVIFPGYYHMEGLDIATLLSTFFLLLGFYILFKTNLKFKILISGFLFSLSFNSKPTSLPIILAIIFYFCYKNVFLHKKKRIHISKKGVYELIILVLPPIFLLAIFIFIQPSYLNDLAFTHVSDIVSKSTLFDALGYLSLSGAIQLFIWIFAIIVLLISLKKPNIYLILALVGFLISGYIWIKWVYAVECNYRYLAPAVPFFILSCIHWFKENKKRSLNFLYVFLLIVLIYFCFKLKFIRAIIPAYLEEPFLHIPISDKTRVISDSTLIKYYVTYDSYTMNNSETEAIESLAQDISQDKYDIIIVSVQGYESPLYQALELSGKKGSYSSIGIMWFENTCIGCNHIIGIFIKNKAADKFIAYSRDYYLSALKIFCFLDNYYSDQVARIIEELDPTKDRILERCTKMNLISDSIHESMQHQILIKNRDLIVLVILFICTILYFYSYKIKKNIYKNF